MSDDKQSMLFSAVKDIGFPIVIALILIWMVRDLQHNSDSRQNDQQTFMERQIEESKKFSRELASVINDNTKSNMELSHAVENIATATEKHTVAIRSLEMELHKGNSNTTSKQN